MRFVFVTVRKELKRRFNDPGGLISAIMIPFAVGFLMASVMAAGTWSYPRALARLGWIARKLHSS